MFAGPNGSGKSSLKAVLDPRRLGHYLNADEILLALVSPRGFSLSPFPFVLTHRELTALLATLTSLHGADPRGLELDGPCVRLVAQEAGYYSAALTDLIRLKLLECHSTFSFETVMSHPSKVDILRNAHALGYRTYLYYVATETVTINISRVRNRVSMGGHDVPEDKIRERYKRSLRLLPEAIQESSRAYIFDNSTENQESVLIAEFTEGSKMTLHVDDDALPRWFVSSVFDRIRFDSED